MPFIANIGAKFRLSLNISWIGSINQKDGGGGQIWGETTKLLSTSNTLSYLNGGSDLKFQIHGGVFMKLPL